MGHGLAEFALSFIKVVNKVAEFDLKAMQFRTQPPFLYDSSKITINPYTLRVEPGAFIPADLSGGMPIASFPLPNESRFSQLTIPDLQKIICDIFMSRGMEDVLRSPKMTATEIAVRQQEFMRRIGGSIGRFAQEFIKPFLTACLKILKSKGKLRDLTVLGQEIGVKVNDQFIRIEYKSPLLAIQSRQEVNNAIEWITMNTQLLQDKAPLAMYLEKIPEWLAEKMNVDLSLVKSSEEVGQLFIARDNQIQNQQMQEVRAQMVLPKNQAMLEQVESERAPNDINIR
jgi:hypothetical protein